MNDTNTNDSDAMTRRTVLTTTAGACLVGLAGCSGSEPDHDDGEEHDDGGSTDNGSAGGSDGGGEDEGDTTNSNDGDTSSDETAEDVENRPAQEDRLTYQDLEIIEHEEAIVEEFDEENIVITGVVENTSDDAYDSVTVGVRAYNQDGHQIDQYLDVTSNLQGGGTWAFEVDIYDTPASEISGTDLGVWGYQW